MFYSPFRPTFTELKRISQHHFRVQADQGLRPQFLTLWELVKGMDVTVQWRLSLLELHSADGAHRSLSTDLRAVSATSMDMEEVEMWAGLEMERAAHNFGAEARLIYLACAVTALALKDPSSVSCQSGLHCQQALSVLLVIFFTVLQSINPHCSLPNKDRAKGSGKASTVSS